MLALIIAVAVHTTVSLFADRLHRTMTNQTAEFLAADLGRSGSTAVASRRKSRADNLALSKHKPPNLPAS